MQVKMIRWSVLMAASKAAMATERLAHSRESEENGRSLALSLVRAEREKTSLRTAGNYTGLSGGTNARRGLSSQLSICPGALEQGYSSHQVHR